MPTPVPNDLERNGEETMTETQSQQGAESHDQGKPPRSKEVPGAPQQRPGARGASSEGSRDRSPLEILEVTGGSSKEIAKAWVRQNQTTAMIGSFVVGAAIGLLMRS